jgi:dTDP-4-dehydrorhamnose 3,5-epimerase
MKIIDEILPDCFLIEPESFVDLRGEFIKTYEINVFRVLRLNFDIKEEFYSISRKNVIRGMHFQRPPHDHEKLVYCTSGLVTDVVLDLRTGSKYGKFASVELSSDNRLMLFVPKGVAHGFVVRTDNAQMVYKTSSVHVPEADSGIHWDSFGFNWNTDTPILSVRDQGHQDFATYQSVF